MNPIPSPPQICKKFVWFWDPTSEFSIISAKSPTKINKFRHRESINCTDPCHINPGPIKTMSYMTHENHVTLKIFKLPRLSFSYIGPSSNFSITSFLIPLHLGVGLKNFNTDFFQNFCIWYLGKVKKFHFATFTCWKVLGNQKKTGR